jgi:hypothetical protein
VASTIVPVLTLIAFALSCRVTASNRVLPKPLAIRCRRKRTKAVRSGVASSAEKPQNRRNDARSSKPSSSLTSDRSYQTASRSALNKQSSGQAGSPFADALILERCLSIAANSIRSTRSFSDDRRVLSLAEKENAS